MIDAQTVTLANGDTVIIPAQQDPTVRTDVWVKAFDGTYRLWLPHNLISELEAKCGFNDVKSGTIIPKGIFAIYGSVTAGRYKLDGKDVSFAVEGVATIRECLETVRLALIGGEAAIVDGVQLRTSPAIAKRLVDNYLATGPAEVVWNLAFLILDVAVNGRAASEEEMRLTPVQGVPSARVVYPSDSDNG